MSEKSNNFRFTLYQGDVLLFEECFDANQFNPYTKHSIDIRSILPKAITTMQKVLSKRSYDVDMGLGNDESINLFQYNQKLINTYPKYQRSEMYYNPKSITQHIEDKTIKGVDCKIGFYINDKTIVEREFYVDGFNPVARWSIDLMHTGQSVCELIFNSIKESDVNNIWDDYDLINKFNLSINEIRMLSVDRRRSLLSKIKYN